MSLSKCQEVDALRKKLYVELPLAEKKIQEEITKLKAALLDIENEKRRVKSKIDFHLKAGQTSKCILDIPHVVWFEVKRLQGHEFALYNACLSSVNIEDAVTGGSARKKLRMLGEKVVAVLIKNYYFNADDLLNFLNTTSLDLQMFAGANWWWLNERNIHGVTECVTFKHPDDISLFYKKAREISNNWLLFRGHKFTFDSTKISTVTDYDLFSEAAISFLEKFGTFILCITVKFDGNLPYNVPLQNCSDLLRIIPNIKYFRFEDVALGVEGITVAAKVNYRTAEPFLSIEGDIVPFQNMACFNSLQQNCIKLEIASWRLENVQQPDPRFWDNAKELVVTIGYPNNEAEPYIKLLCADFSKLQNIKKLVFDTDSCGWRSLALLVKFPNVTDVELWIKDSPFGNSDDKIYNMNVPEIPFPKVTKFTITTYNSEPPTLDIIPTVLPSLRELRLKLWCLEERWKKSHDEGRFNDHHIDVCRLIAEYRSLKESNIWNEMHNLKQFCLQGKIQISGDVERITGMRWLSNYCIHRSEIYTRMKHGSIGFKNIVTYN